MVMRFEVHALGQESRVAEGTNMLAAFPLGTILTGYSVNGKRFPSLARVVADGNDMVIALDQIREAIKQGAPRLYRRPLMQAPPPAAA